MTAGQSARTAHSTSSTGSSTDAVGFSWVQAARPPQSVRPRGPNPVHEQTKRENYAAKHKNRRGAPTERERIGSDPGVDRRPDARTRPAGEGGSNRVFRRSGGSFGHVPQKYAIA
ncbi:hypothetical protein MTIM_45120 [Mycobacterium timonense]|uniref:Uncharacterized protein n=1 Tax=Mycobacterium timonense TaxID=701043 RepID=A0A7I9ZCC3_9MYCO|nr:hypothetical protein MTIM_45120 [Mycobacterium timonense]